MKKLIDITGFEYDFSITQNERKNHFLNYVKDPNNFLCCGYKVTVEFAGNKDFESCLAQGLENSK